jgi:uncharacterized membrane protein YqjE
MSATERPVALILQEIIRNLQDIVRSEVRLARAEVREELTKTRSASLLVALGAASGCFSAFLVLLTLVYALSLVIPVWAAALCVAIGVGVLAAIMLRAGLARLKTIHPTAPKTRASVKENVEWAKRQIK